MRGKLFILLMGLIFCFGIARGDGSRSINNLHQAPPPNLAHPWSELMVLPPDGHIKSRLIYFNQLRIGPNKGHDTNRSNSNEKGLEKRIR